MGLLNKSLAKGVWPTPRRSKGVGAVQRACESDAEGESSCHMAACTVFGPERATCTSWSHPECEFWGVNEITGFIPISCPW